MWCGDVTYIWSGQRWGYLAVVMDLFARKPVGWAFSLSLDSELTAKALTLAFEARGRELCFTRTKVAITATVGTASSCGDIE